MQTASVTAGAQHAAGNAAEELLRQRIALAAEDLAESSAWRQQRPRVIFGIHTSSQDKYAAKLAAGRATWARDINPNRILAIGPCAPCPC